MASVISAVDTFPVAYPAAWASSRIVFGSLPGVNTPGSVEIRSFDDFLPVAQALAVGAESGT